MNSLSLNKIQPSVASAKTFLDRSQQKMFINGQWVDAYNGSTFETIDPGTGAVISELAKEALKKSMTQLTQHEQHLRVISGIICYLLSEHKSSIKSLILWSTILMNCLN